MPQARPQPKKSILAIAPYVGGKSKAAPGVRVVKLSSNETPLGPSPKAREAFIASAETLHRYPDGGASTLRHAISDVYGIPADRIVCGAGSDELIALLIHSYTTPGDEVLYSQHGFLMYKIYAQAAGAVPVAAPEKNLTADVDAILSCVTPRTKIVFLANPNNPTGSYISTAELHRLQKGLPPQVILAIDGAYAEYVEARDYSTGRELVDATPNTVMLRTFSKIYGLSALRLGWAYAPAEIADTLNRVRGPFNVSGPAQAAGAAAMRDIAHMEKSRAFNKEWLAWLSREIAALGIKVHPSIANFILVEFKNATQAEQACAFLMARGLIVRDVVAYGLPNCLRISVGLEDDNRAVVAALKEFLAVSR